MRKYTKWGTQTSYRDAHENGVFVTSIWDEKAAEIENEAMERAAVSAGYDATQIRHFWAVRTGYNFYWFPDEPEPKPHQPQFRERGY